MKTTSTLNPVKVTEHVGRNNERVKLITGILHWEYEKKEVYSLARCYVLPNKLIVVLSGLAIEGFHVQPLVSDYVGVANTLWQTLGENLNVKPKDITWIGHYGLFSEFDTVWSVDIDSFSKYDLEWNGSNFYYDSKDEDISTGTQEKKERFDIDAFCNEFDLFWDGSSYCSTEYESNTEEVLSTIPLPLIPVEKVLKSLGWKTKYES